MFKYLTTLSFGVVLGLGMQPVEAQYCDNAAGILESVLIDGEPVLVAADEHVSIRRDGSNIDVTNGMPLCPEDTIFVAQGSAAKILSGQDGNHVNEITIVGEAEAEIQNRTSLIARLGRFFGLIRGEFSVRDNNDATYGAKGTQFEITVGAGVTVVQLDGEVAYSPSPGSQNDPLTVARLQQLHVPEANSPDDATLEPLLFGQCANVTTQNSDIFIRSRPRMPLRNSIETFDAAERPGSFVAARVALLCKDNQAAISAVSRAYADWEHPGVDIDSINEIPAELSTRERAQFAADRAESLRLTGRLDESMNGFRTALSLDEEYAVAFLGLGRTVGDMAISGFDPEEPNSRAEVISGLATSERYVRMSLRRNLWGMGSDHNQAVGLIELADISLLRATLEPDSANSHLATAVQLYERALQTKGGDAPFAQVGLARSEIVRASLIPDTKIVGEDLSEVLKAQFVADLATNLQRQSHWKNARNQIRELLESYPGFSTGHTELGRVYLLLNEKRDARRRFKNAIRINPTNHPAYFSLVAAMENDGDLRDQRRMYRSAYQAAVAPERARVTLALTDIQQSPRVKPIEVDMLALAASPSSVLLQPGTGSAAVITLSNTGNQTVTVGNIRLGGSNPEAFEFDARRCAGRSLDPGDDCTIRVSIRTQDEGDYRATLVIESSSGVDARVPLSASIPKPFVVE